MLSLKEEQQELFDKHSYLIPVTINRQFRNSLFHELHGLTIDNLQQSGRLGLLKACKTYDSSKGTKFRTFAIKNIIWKINLESRRESLGNNGSEDFDLVDRTSLDRELPNGDDVSVTLHDVVESHETGYKNVELEDTLKAMTFAVPSEVVDIVRMRIDGYTYKEIGKTLEVTHQAVRQRLARYKTEIIKELFN